MYLCTCSVFVYIPDDFEYSESVKGDKKIVKVVEKINRCDVFFINTDDKRDGLCVYKLKEKIVGDQTLYSESIFATGEQWRITKQRIREIAKQSEANEVLKQKVQSDLHSIVWIEN